MRPLFLTAFLILALAGAAFVSAQDSAAWRVTAVEPLVVSNDASPRIFPAPDGHQVAYERVIRLDGHRDFKLCLYDALAPSDPRCNVQEKQPPRGYEPDPLTPLVPFSWSPDSAKIAVVGQPLGTLTDTDLWIFTIADQKWVNLADDHYDGALVAGDNSPAPPAGVFIDVQPSWSPDGKQIAVERTLTDESGTWGQARLTLIDAVDGSAHDLIPLPGHETHPSDSGSTTSLVWSPDGTTLALSIRHRDIDPDSDGIWLVSVADSKSQRLVSLKDAEKALQGIYDGLALQSIGPLMWSPDGSRLLFWAGDPTQKPIIAWLFWVDLQSGQTTTVPLPKQTNDTPTKRTIRPLQAIWSPDSSALLISTIGVPKEDAPNPLNPKDAKGRVSIRIVDAATLTDHSLGQLPLGPSTALYQAAWAASGDVIINGYHLKLTK
jgi:hypothetical protein